MCNVSQGLIMDLPSALFISSMWRTEADFAPRERTPIWLSDEVPKVTFSRKCASMFLVVIIFSTWYFLNFNGLPHNQEWSNNILSYIKHIIWYLDTDNHRKRCQRSLLVVSVLVYFCFLVGIIFHYQECTVLHWPFVIPGMILQHSVLYQTSFRCLDTDNHRKSSHLRCQRSLLVVGEPLLCVWVS